jgi:hypothetical protein
MSLNSPKTFWTDVTKKFTSGKLPHVLDITLWRKRRDTETVLRKFLLHELIAYNKLLEAISSSICRVLDGLKGLVVMDEELELLVKRVVANRVPEIWRKLSFPSVLDLRTYVKDLKMRTEFLEKWLVGDQPLVFNLGAMFHPDEFLACVLQTHARKHSISVDRLGFVNSPVSGVIGRQPEEGVYIEKLALEGAKWDGENNVLKECGVRELLDWLPVMHLVPSESEREKAGMYECPVYRTRVRGTGPLDLSNYVVSYWLPTKEGVSCWVERGVAAFLTG